MCRTVVWSVNAAAFTTDFERYTDATLGVPPQRTPLRIVAHAVRASSVPFVLTVNGCDCRGLVGLGPKGAPGPGELSVDGLLGWLRGLGGQVPNLSDLAVATAWNPEEEIRPDRTRHALVDEVDETMLRAIGTEELLLISWPPRWSQR